MAMAEEGWGARGVREGCGLFQGRQLGCSWHLLAGTVSHPAAWVNRGTGLGPAEASLSQCHRPGPSGAESRGRAGQAAAGPGEAQAADSLPAMGREDQEEKRPFQGVLSKPARTGRSLSGAARPSFGSQCPLLRGSPTPTDRGAASEAEKQQQCS